VKFRSNLIQVDLFTAESAGQRNDRQEVDTKLLTLNTNSIHPDFFLFNFFNRAVCFADKT
jgi:hypothetical protein